MATRAADLHISLTDQIEGLNKDFQKVEGMAKKFEHHQVRAVALLHDAMTEIYSFGETVLLMAPLDGKPVIEQFFLDNKVSINARVQANAYIGLVKMAFKGSSDSSRSQYSTVLHFAFRTGVKPANFKAWISDGGIERRRNEAVEDQNSTAKQRNDRKKVALIESATAELAMRKGSTSVALPEGVTVPEGYAIFLARVDGSNAAKIIDVIETDTDKVNAQIVALVKPEKPAATFTGPLAPMLRAIDLITKLTPAKVNGQVRDLLICNTADRGNPVTHIAATSAARSFPGARIALAGHAGDLPPDQTFILKAAHASFLLSIDGKHDDLGIDATGAITGTGLHQSIALVPLTEPSGYRLATPAPQKRETAFDATSEQLNALSAYIKQEREAFKRRTADRQDKPAFYSTADIEWNDGKLLVSLPQSMRSSTLGDAAPNEVAANCTVLLAELEGITETLAGLHLSARGWIVDTDVDNAALVFTAQLDSDELSIVLPTRVGSDYNHVCEAVLIP